MQVLSIDPKARRLTRAQQSEDDRFWEATWQLAFGFELCERLRRTRITSAREGDGEREECVDEQDMQDRRG